MKGRNQGTEILQTVKRGLFLDYADSSLEIPLELVRAAERLGFDSIWSAEAYGSDAITPLAYLAGKTQRIRLGTGIAQVAARAPTMAAMQMGSLDALSGGRTRDRGVRPFRTAGERASHPATTSSRTSPRTNPTSLRRSACSGRDT